MSDSLGSAFDEDDDMPEDMEEFLGELRELAKATFPLAPQCEMIPNASGRFGYDQTNPIPVRWPEGEVEYLSRLRCECGEPFGFYRLGNLGAGPDGHIIDAYRLICKGGGHEIVLCMDMYHAGPSSMVPEELATGSPEGVELAVVPETVVDGLLESVEGLSEPEN